MDIPEAARQAKMAEIDRDYPQMSKYPDVAKQFLEAQLEDEWGRAPKFPGGIGVEHDQGLVRLSLLRAPGGNAMTAPLTMPEAHDLFGKLKDALGL